MTTILACGGRDYTDRDRAFRVLDAAVDRLGLDVLIQGEEPNGLDALAKEWALVRGILCVGVKADWDRHGKAAGPIRNKLMADMRPDRVIAFPTGGTGTANMIGIARERGITVTEIV